MSREESWTMGTEEAAPAGESLSVRFDRELLVWLFGDSMETRGWKLAVGLVEKSVVALGWS